MVIRYEELEIDYKKVQQENHKLKEAESMNAVRKKLDFEEPNGDAQKKETDSAPPTPGKVPKLNLGLPKEPLATVSENPVNTIESKPVNNIVLNPKKLAFSLSLDKIPKVWLVFVVVVAAFLLYSFWATRRVLVVLK